MKLTYKGAAPVEVPDLRATFVAGDVTDIPDDIAAGLLASSDWKRSSAKESES